MRLMLKVGIITCCLLLVGFACVFGTTISTSTNSSTTAKPTTAESLKKENATDDSQKDLDLETQDQVAILKQINRVNDDGSYTFGYEAADGSFKIETRDVAGNVKGMFGFVDETGELKRVSYSASNGTGFQSTGDSNIPPLPGTIPSAEEEATGNYKKIPTRLYQQIVRPKDFTVNKNDESSTVLNSIEVSTQRDYSSTTVLPPTSSSPKLPIYIFGTSSTPRYDSVDLSEDKSIVIQQIPRIRPTLGSSTTDHTGSSVVIERKPTFGDYMPRRSSVPSYISLGSSSTTSTTTSRPTSTTTLKPSHDEITQAITRKPTTLRPRTPGYRKIVVTRKPLEATTPKQISTTALPLLHEKQHHTETILNPDPNGLRRQSLNQIPLSDKNVGLAVSGSEDSPDVYGAAPVARPFPTSAFRGFYSALPQHQRILQNSFIQNQDQYLAAGYGSRLPPPGPLPQDNLDPADSSNREEPAPPPPPPPQRPLSRRPISPPLQHVTPQIPPQYKDYQDGPAPVPYQPNPEYQATSQPSQTLNPALMQQLIRMLLLTQQQRQQQQSGLSPFQQALLSTLGPENIPPELLDRRQYNAGSQMPYPDPRYGGQGYDPRYNQPQYDPRYNQQQYDPRYNQQQYDPRYNPPQYDPRYGPQSYFPRNPYFPPQAPPPPYNPRQYYEPYYNANYPNAGYPPPQLGGYGPYPQQRLPYPQGPIPEDYRDMFLLRMLLGGRFPGGPLPGTLTSQIQNAPDAREPKPSRDSTAAASTTSRPFSSTVRNVQIITSDDSDPYSSRS